MSGWNFADVFEAIATALPEAPAQRHGDRATTWAEFDRRADGLGRVLLDAGLREQDKVAQYLYNGSEYLESVFGSFKAGMAIVNTNYRYTADELVYLWDNADTAAVIFHGTFTDRIEGVRSRVPGVRLWIHVDDGTGPTPDWAVPYEELANSSGDRAVGPWGRSGDHLLLLYTGGTTGMPKGVMWRQADVIGALEANNRRRLPDTVDAAAVIDRLRGPGPRGLPGAPLMHGTGFFNAMSTLLIGGSITTLVGRRFDPVELVDTIDREGINSISIVGDAFAKPILEALDTEPERWDISSLRVIVSSGVMWSKATKEGLLRHNPRLILLDTLGSSEADWHGDQHDNIRQRRRDRHLHPRSRHSGRHRGRARRGPRFGRAWSCRPAWPHAARLLQGRGEVRGHLPGHRWGALFDSRRLGGGR